MEQKIDKRTHKFRSDYGLEDYYAAYSREHKDDGLYIDYKTYSKLLDEVMKGIASVMISQMYDFKLPHGLGKVITRKFEPKIRYDDNGEPYIRRAIDWKETNKMWEEHPELRKVQYVYFTNEHSMGYTFTVMYRKSGVRFSNRLFYTAQINRAVKRGLAKSIKDGTFDALETNYK